PGCSTRWVTPACLTVQDQLPEAGQLERTVRQAGVTHRVLHPGIGRDNEETRNPGSQKHRHGRPAMSTRAELLLPIEEQPQESRLQEEGEHAFHGEGLTDDVSGESR